MPAPGANLRSPANLKTCLSDESWSLAAPITLISALILLLGEFVTPYSGLTTKKDSLYYVLDTPSVQAVDAGTNLLHIHLRTTMRRSVSLLLTRLDEKKADTDSTPLGTVGTP